MKADFWPSLISSHQLKLYIRLNKIFTILTGELLQSHDPPSDISVLKSDSFETRLSLKCIIIYICLFSRGEDASPLFCVGVIETVLLCVSPLISIRQRGQRVVASRWFLLARV